MSGSNAALRWLLAISLVAWLPVTVSSYTSAELGAYKDKALMAADFTLKDLDGKTHKLSDYRGKVVVFEFGSST